MQGKGAAASSKPVGQGGEIHCSPPQDAASCPVVPGVVTCNSLALASRARHQFVSCTVLVGWVCAQAIRELRALPASTPRKDNDALTAAMRLVRSHLGSGAEPRVRKEALRALRHLCTRGTGSAERRVCVRAWRVAWREYLDLFLAASLDRNHRTCDAERLEALRLCVALGMGAADVGVAGVSRAGTRGTVGVPDAPLSALLSLADAADDPMRQAALEVLRMLAVADVRALSRPLSLGVGVVGGIGGVGGGVSSGVGSVSVGSVSVGGANGAVRRSQDVA